MPVVDVSEAEAMLSRLVQAVESGAEEEIVIARDGKPAARLVAVESNKPPRKLSQYKGVIPAFTLEEWNESGEEVAEQFGARN
jgi:antitoxin (DNA-binding transcriptional repressor) of toxin-antitoxin stability system